MAKFVILLVCLAVIETSWALKCKMCKDLACTTLEDQSCEAPPSNSDSACLYHVYKNSASDKEEITEKKCVNKIKDKKFDCIKHTSSEVEIKCETCDKDLCNEKSGASKVSLGSLAAVGIVVALVAPKFL